MSKKKAHDKGKSKLTAYKGEDLAFKKTGSENTEEEYTTVAEYETNKTYSKRLVQCNWAKYEAGLPDYENDDEEDDIPKMNDFNNLLKTASSDCSYFQFNSEKLWKSEESSVASSAIFNLDLDILSSGLACVPFYERMGLDENDLTVEEKQRFDAEAEKCFKDYMLLREKSLKKVEDEPKVKLSDSILRTLQESFRDNLDLVVGSEKDEKPIGGSSIIETENSGDNIKKVEMIGKNEGNGQKGGNKNKIFVGENDEDLEDWLDSVLDD